MNNILQASKDSKYFNQDYNKSISKNEIDNGLLSNVDSIKKVEDEYGSKVIELDDNYDDKSQQKQINAEQNAK